MSEVIKFEPRRPMPIVPDFDSYDARLDWFRALPTSTLKRMWDDNGDYWHGWCDEVHRVMNERGEGDYVCV